MKNHGIFWTFKYMLLSIVQRFRLVRGESRTYIPGLMIRNTVLPTKDWNKLTEEEKYQIQKEAYQKSGVIPSIIAKN